MPRPWATAEKQITALKRSLSCSKAPVLSVPETCPALEKEQGMYPEVIWLSCSDHS